MRAEPSANTTHVSAFGLEQFTTDETIELDPDGRTFRMSGVQRPRIGKPEAYDATASHLVRADNNHDVSGGKVAQVSRCTALWAVRARRLRPFGASRAGALGGSTLRPMGRLGADASRVIEAARELARKHRHETVGPEHLLAALLADDRMEQLLTEHVVDAKDLERRLVARFAEWPSSGLYRDAVAEPVPSAAFESLIARAGAGRLMALVRPVTLVQLARAAGSEPCLALLRWDASMEIGSTKDALTLARTFALSRREGWVSIFHLFAVLVKQAPLKNALREAHVDRDALVERIVMRLDDEPRFEEVVLDGLARLEDLRILLPALLRTKAIDVLLAELGTSVLELMQALVRAASMATACPTTARRPSTPSFTTTTSRPRSSSCACSVSASRSRKGER